MTEQESIDRLNALSGADPEFEHGEADEILCQFLKANGYEALAESFDAASERVGFWYS